MTDREKIIKSLKNALNSLDYTSDLRLVLIRTIEYLQQEPHKELYDKLSKLTEDALAKETKESWNEFLDNKPVSEGLDEAAEEYLPYPCPMWYAGDDSGYENAEREVNIRREAFKAGAKWQKTKDESTTEDLGGYINELSKQFPEVSFAKLSRIAVRVAKWKEQQLMANAVEGVVHHFEKCKVASVHYNDPTGVPMAYFTSQEGLSAGDKVKIIVIKED